MQNNVKTIKIKHAEIQRKTYKQNKLSNCSKNCSFWKFLQSEAKKESFQRIHIADITE